MTILADLLAKIASADIIAKVKTTAMGLGLFPDDWQSGDPEDAIVNSVAQTIADWWNTYVWSAINGGFGSTAAAPRGQTNNKWMTLFAKGVFNVDRILATFAAGGWTGTNASGSPLGPYASGALLFVCLDTGNAYTNQDAATFAPGANAPIVIVANALGSASNAAPTRVVLQTTVVNLSGTNALSITGRDDEADQDLWLRCQLKWASLSPNGPKQAYQYVALTPSFHGVTVNRVLVDPPPGDGTLLVTIASPSGIVTTPNVALVDAAIKLNVQPETVTETTQSASAVSVNVTCQIWAHADSGIVPATAQAAINAALVLAFQLFPIGGEVIAPATGMIYVKEIEDIIARAVPQAFEVSVTVPASDVALGAHDVGTLGTVATPVITVVP